MDNEVHSQKYIFKTILVSVCVNVCVCVVCMYTIALEYERTTLLLGNTHDSESRVWKL